MSRLLARRVLAEFLGTGLLVALVVGSGMPARMPAPRRHTFRPRSRAELAAPY